MGNKSNTAGPRAPESPLDAVLSDRILGTRRSLWAVIAALTLAMEVPALFCRFALGWSTTETTAYTLGRLTFGLRIHHGYFCLLLLPAAWWLRHRRPRLARWLFVLGTALLLSDLIHHFLILWPLTGSPDWDWRYGE